MSSQYFTGTAQAIAQVATITPASPAAADVDLLTIKDELGNTIATVSYTVLASPSATIVSGAIIALWNANPVLAALATASGTATIVLTALKPGVPFYVTSSVTGTGTLTTVATVANAGPSVVSMAANWSAGTAPANGDKLTFDVRALADALYGLDQSSVTPAEVHYDLSCKNIGQATIPLKWAGVTAWDVGRNPANIQPQQGAGRINIDHGTGAGAGVVYTTNPNPLDTGQETLRIKATNSSNTIAIAGGLVGISTNLPSDTSTFATISIDGGTVNIASGVTWTTLVNDGGTVTVRGAGTTAGNYSKNGSLTFTGLGLVATVNAAAGNIFLNNRPASGNAVTTLNQTGATIDCTGAPSTFAIGTWNFSNGKFIQAGPSQVSFGATAINGWLTGTFQGSQS